MQKITAIEIANDKDYQIFLSSTIAIADELRENQKGKSDSEKNNILSKIQMLKTSASSKNDEKNKSDFADALKEIGFKDVSSLYAKINQIEQSRVILLKKYQGLDEMSKEEKQILFEEAIAMIISNKGKSIGNGRAEDACGQKLSSCNNKAYAEYAVIGIGCVGAAASGVGFWLGVGCALTNGWYLNAQLDDCQSDYALCIQPKS